MNIEYFTKQVYGKDTMYIHEEKIANLIQTLTGEKSLTSRAKQALEELGFTFTEILAPKK